MIDPSFVDITDEELSRPNGFVVPYPPTVKELEEKIADLENKLSLKTQSWEFASSEYKRLAAQIELFEGALKHNEWDFDQDTLESLADFFDITLEREYEVTVTVTFTGTVSVPYDYDIDDLENDLSASLDTHHYGNSSVTVEFSEDSMEIDYREV